jgi:hypothetical protein
MAHLQVLLTNLEPVFLLIAGVCFVKSGSARRLPALGAYFLVRGSMLLALEGLLWSGGMPTMGTVRFSIYFYGYWSNYVVTAIAIFLVVQEIFKRVMEPVPGLRRLGLLAFRWISIVSVVVAVGAVALPAAARSAQGYQFQYLVGSIGLEMMRVVSILELCLLAFLALSIHTLGRSFRSRLFGVGLGFGLQAAAELVGSALLARYSTLALTSAANLFLQVSTTVVLLTWTAYFLVPEPAAERSLIVLPPSSAMARWNALAKGIGQTPEVALSTQPSGFFLQDIEGVVDRVLAKNPVVAAR